MGNYRVDYKNGGPTHQSDLTKKSGGASYSAAAVNQGGGSTHQASMSGKSGGPSYDAAVTNKSGGATRPAVPTIKSGGASYRADVVKKSGGPTHPAKYKPSVKSFAEVQQIVRAGKAKDVFDIGHEFVTHYTYEGTVYDMPWVVLDNDRLCEWHDGSKHPGLWIGSKYATIEKIQFDAPEQEEATEATAQEGLFYCGRNGSTYTMLKLSAGDTIPYGDYQDVYHSIVNNRDVFSNGYNRYLHCAQRQWLNSDATFGGWWTSQHVGDCAPSELQTVKGFMAGLDTDFLSVINPVKIQVATNVFTDGGVTDVMYDKFFMQSAEELYGIPHHNDVEGPFFPYWKQITGLENPTNGSGSNPNDARKIRKLNDQSGDAVGVRLRSANRGSSNIAWLVHSGGYLYYDSSLALAALSSFATLPACVIS